MGLAYLPTYIVIASLLAPLAWVMWWAVASATSADNLSPVRRPKSQLNQIPAPVALPQPVDMNLPKLPGRIGVFRLSDGVEIRGCSGPDHDGKCPGLLADGTVPCAGLMLSLPMSIRGSREWHIPIGQQTCLVGSYDVFRQKASAG